MSSDEFEFDEIALDEIEAIESHYVHGTALPPRSAVNKPGLVQRDLFGAAVVPPPPKPAPRAGPSRTFTIGGGGGPVGAGGETRAKTRISKRWDPASFAKHGWSKKNAAVAKAKATGKRKGKQRDYGSDEEPWDEDEVLDDDDDDGDVEFLIDTTYDPNAPILPIKWPPDSEASKTFVYPVQADKPLRVYQYNIVQSALYKNTLVSLPTGLGKTFIAACVMLNFYRWYPRGKVLFLAPTRPLVTQQIKACHYIAGIPQADSIELTGGTMAKLRSLGWATKRVIYSTPQTVERDLAKGRLDPRDVTLVVVDEAHRASGDYSYCGVIRYLMCRNPHFRVLALTATPGARGEAVQEVIDNLHIGHIEVRADDSLDIRQYIHKKSFDLTVLPLGPVLGRLRDKWAELMQPYIGPLLTARLIYSGDAVMLSPFAVQQAYGKIKSLPGGGKGNGRYFPLVKTLAQMCRAMEYLVIQSVTSFHSSLKDIEANGSKKLVESAGFKQVLNEVTSLRGRPGYVGHPKMEKLRSMCIEHFKASSHEIDEYTGEKRETRVMIFCNFRAVVEEIVDCLNTQRPLIKATPFVGQASSKGTKGKSQKEQLETIRKFKKGVYNVLVATSIGEEGLDIGEIDLIVCYEANKSPIRMLQRVGRTGRARDGHIIVLMSEGREERNWDRANDAYNEVQNALTSNKIFDLYADCERLLPPDVKPVCEKVEIKAQPLNLDAITMNGQSRAERKFLADEKKNIKKIRDPKANVPVDAFDGFRTAGQLAAASKVKAPTASQTLRERKGEALLTPEQEGELRTRWMLTPAGEPVRPRRFRTDGLPFDSGSSGSCHRISHHGQRHLDLLAALRVTEQLSDSKPDALDVWHDKLSSAFNAKYVEIFKREEGDPPPPKHRRLRQPTPSEDEDEDLATTFPALTGFPMAARYSSLSSLAGPVECEPLFRPSSPALDPFGSPDPPANKRPRKESTPPLPPSKRPRTSFPSKAAPSSDPAASGSARGVEDSIVLSSDDESTISKPKALPLSRPPGPDSRRAEPSSTSFSMDIDDDPGAAWSESEVLKGAVIRGKSVPESSTTTSSDGLERQRGEIVLDDSDEETNVGSGRPCPPKPPAAPRKPPLPPIASSRVSSAPALLAKPVSAPHPTSNSLQSARSPPQRTISAGSAGFRPFVPPRLSAGSQPREPPAPAAAPSIASSPQMAVEAQEKEDDDDEYSFFDLPESAFDEVALSQIAPAAIRGRPVDPPTTTTLASDEAIDSLIMPPPPPSVSRARPLPRPGLAGPSKRQIVPPSSDDPVGAGPPSSDPVSNGFRPAKALLPADINVVSRPVDARPLPVPMRRLAVPDSSSPAVPRSSTKQAAGALDAPDLGQDGHDLESSVASVRVPKALNRLRRGRQVVESDEEQGAGRTSEARVGRERAENPRTKAQKRKKEVLTHKQASRFGIFDVEAVNSSASGSEASSEEYDSENSIDREFVADDDEDVEGDEGDGPTFYHHRLATQEPTGTQPGWVKRRHIWAQPDKWESIRLENEAKKREKTDRRNGRHDDDETQATPHSEPSQFSYDSFCVPDDEELVYDDSQEEQGSSQL
ncbi:hypothetical protein JCM10212_005308 [Sporobolomyces blumeae]